MFYDDVTTHLFIHLVLLQVLWTSSHCLLPYCRYCVITHCDSLWKLSVYDGVFDVVCCCFNDIFIKHEFAIQNKN